MSYKEPPVTGTTNNVSVTFSSSANVLALGTTPRITSISFDSGTNNLGNYVQHGTFTPTVRGSTVAGTITYSTQQGHYSRIGYLCYFFMLVGYSAATGSTGNLEILGLPFNPKALSGVWVPIFTCATANVAFSAGYSYHVAAFSGSGATLNVVQCGSAVAGQAIAFPVPGSAKTYSISGTYLITGA